MGILDFFGYGSRPDTTAYTMPGATGYQNWSWVARPDGGVDYLLNGQKNTRENFVMGTGQDAGAIESWAQQFAAQPTNREDTSIGTAPTASPTQQTEYLNQYNQYLDNYKSQFQPLYDKYINDLQSGYSTKKADFENQYTTSKNKLLKNYWDMANENDKGFYSNLKNTQSAYAGRNLQDSSFFNNATTDINSNFNDYYSRINQQKDEGLGSLDKQKNDYYSSLDKTLTEGRATADRIKNNFYNPEAPKFGSLEELYSAKSNLDSQLNQLKSTPTFGAGQISAPTMNTSVMGQEQAQNNGQWNYNQNPQGYQTSPEKKPYFYQDTYWNNYFYPKMEG